MMSRLLIGVLLAYQRYISPLSAARCKFYPSCSAYALEAVTVHGAFRGSWLTLRRLSRCHPFHPGGVDLVPPPAAPSSDGCAGIPSGVQR
jgi:putative membrane protein insertion efficiency factor